MLIKVYQAYIGIQVYIYLYNNILIFKRFLEDRDIDAIGLNVGGDMRKINFCFKHLKELHHASKTG